MAASSWTVAAGNLIYAPSSFSQPQIRLIGGVNLVGANDDFEVSVGDWAAGDAYGAVARVFNPYGPRGRYVLEVSGVSASETGYAIATFDTGQTVTDESFLASCWVMSPDRDITDFRLQLVGTTTTEAHHTGDVALTQMAWTQVVLIASFATATDDTLKMYLMASHTPSATARVFVARPRLHRIFETLNGFPDNPLPEIRFEPWEKLQPWRSAYGDLSYARDGFVPRVRFPHPAVTGSETQLVVKIMNHRGLLAVQPDANSSFVMLMRHVSGFEYETLAQRALGYQGELELVGVEPMIAIPGGVFYVEEEATYYVVRQNFVVAS
jgi:hypothetical protein